MNYPATAGSPTPMRRATRAVAAALGIVAGFAGLEHGYFELQQGPTPPAGLFFPSIGPPCIPQQTWNACEPALSIVPSLLVSGILSLLIGAAIMVWSVAFLQHRHGGAILMALSIALLLCGGGIFPPLIGLIGGAAATTILRPLDRKPLTRVTRLAAGLWPWPLAILVAWLLGQFAIGSMFNDFLASVMSYGLALILLFLPLSVYSGYARDRLE